MGIACYVCGKIGKVQRPIDPAGAPGRRWSCEQHFAGKTDPEVEKVVAALALAAETPDA